MHLYEWSVFFLGACSLVCLTGLASPRYHENLPMCVGMCLLAIGCASRAHDIAEQAPVIPWDWFLVHAGLGTYSLGVLFDVFLRERRQRFVAFAHSTFERLHGWPARFEATNHPMLRKSAVDKRTDHR